MSQTPDPKQALRALLEGFLGCPTEPALTELEQALRAYQTEWIRARAGGDAPPAREAARPAGAKPRFPIPSADLDTLGKIADGWAATTAEVRRWAWLEDRELVVLEPNPAGTGPELLRLAPAGWAAIGRAPGA
ncbi:hypothetical protein [Azospirillum sp. SYSU D00513]|uniref:hypothetical protein n=1 Tax=Azospirillum sp. SYSU D00513 TaxID=2812561 RepID=UPI001A978534|nr:hypothetical protein [Azospirillum sp. SYSU D00513]